MLPMAALCTIPTIHAQTGHSWDPANPSNGQSAVQVSSHPWDAAHRNPSQCVHTHPHLQSACPCAMSITQRHTSSSSPSMTKPPIPHQHPVQKFTRTELKGARTCWAETAAGAQHPGSTLLPMLPPAPEPSCRRLRSARPPLAGGWFGHSLPARSRHLSCPVSSPLSTNSHNSAELLLMARPGSSRAETQPQREPPSKPPGKQLSGRSTHSLTQGQLQSHRRGTQIRGNNSKCTQRAAHTHTLDFSQPGGALCSCPRTADVPAGMQRLSPLMSSRHPRSESMWGCSPPLPWEKGLAGDSHC